MGRKAFFIVLAGFVALALVPAGASAANLTEERATVLATKLARQVAKERDARYARIQRLVKKRTNRFVFEYFERLREDDRFCRANVIVVQSGNRRTASLAGSRCGTMRADILAYEEAISDALRAVEPKVPEMKASADAYEDSLEACAELDHPARYLDNISELFELGSELAVYGPIVTQLDAFAKRLAAIGSEDRLLARGATSWRKYLELLSSIPEVARDPCPAVRRWAREDYADESAPAEFVQVRALTRSLVRHGRAILAAADRLYDLGLSERTFTSFTPLGLITTAAADFED